MKKHIFGFLLLGVCLAGCIPSLNPLYTDKDLIFDPDLLGTWFPDNSKETWVFEKEGTNAYKLVFTESDGKSGEFNTHLLKLGTNQFLDLFPDESGVKEMKRNDYYKMHLIPAHSFIRVLQIKPTLKMSVMQNEWLGELLKQQPTAIAHERVQQQVVLTASTKKLQQFVLSSLGKPEAWGEPTEFSREKK